MQKIRKSKIRIKPLPIKFDTLRKIVTNLSMLPYEHFIYKNVKYIYVYSTYNLIVYKLAGKGNKKEIVVERKNTIKK